MLCSIGNCGCLRNVVQKQPPETVTMGERAVPSPCALPRSCVWPAPVGRLRVDNIQEQQPDGLLGGK